LINAYRTSAKDAIENNVIIEEIVKSNYILKFSYNEMNSVMKLIKDNNINQLNQNFDLNCSLEIEINVKDEEIVIEKLKKINGVKINKILNK
jgi:putative IMPACT (imprinted ancient) family translation regulator